jgi:outer membrane lipoprotein-sorting protein
MITKSGNFLGRKAMNLPRSLRVIVFLAIAVGLMTCGSVSAQGGGKSQAELSAQAKKIKNGETTEAEVITLLGRPSKTWQGTVPFRKGREFKEVKKLIYSSPETKIVVIIDKSTGKVFNVTNK